MPKSIKNIIKILTAGITVIILSVLIITLLLSNSSTQTFIAKRITDYFSNEINSTITLDKIKFTYFNRLVVNNLLIKDQNYDTLIFAPELSVNLRKYDYKTGTLTLGRVTAVSPRLYLITDSTGLMNLNWYLNMLKGSQKEPGSAKNKFYINRINISNGKFRLAKSVRKSSETPVDFNNLRLDSLYATVTNLEIKRDSLKLDIDNLRFRESSGFAVKNMTSHFSVYEKTIVFNDVELESDSSLIYAPVVSLIPDSASGFRNFINDVKLDIQISNSQIAGSEIRYFMPLKSFPENIMGFRGNISGSISELRGKNIRISFSEKSVIDMNFNLSGLPDIKNTFIFFEINRLETSLSDIEKIKISKIYPLALPAYLKEAEYISFTGTFTGFTTDFVTYGRLYTSLGIISSDISLRPESSKIFRIKGLLKGQEIDIGKITGNSSLLGKSTVVTDIDGEIESFKTFAVNLRGTIDSIEINNYKYRNIGLAGYFTDKTWDGTIKIEDNNIRLELLGMFDFSRDLPEFDFTLNLRNADLYRLNIDRKDTTSAASLLITANFRGNNIDNLDGEIKLLNSNFRKYGKNLEVYDFSLKTSSENNIQSLLLNTDFLDAEIHGRYNFSTLVSKFKGLLASFFPSRNKLFPPVSADADNKFTLKINFKKIDALNNFLKTGLSISENSVLSGIVNPDTAVILTGRSDNFAIKNNTFSNLTFNLTYSDSLFNAKVRTTSLNIINLAELKNFEINLSSFSDHFRTAIEWDDKSKIANKGFFEVTGEYKNRVENEDKKSLLRLGILPGEVFVRNNLWKINPAEIIIDSNSVKISRFLISNNENYFSIEGTASHDKLDTIFIKVNGINISGLNNLYEKKAGGDNNNLHLAIGGILGGTISFTDIYRNFMFESDLRISDFAMLESNYGEVKIGSKWNRAKKLANIEINNNLGGKRMLDIKGYYDPENRFIDLTASADRLPVEILNPLLKIFASDITGTASGKVRFSGELNKPYLTGSLFADNASIKIDYLQSKFGFSDSIKFDHEAIRFNNIVFKDERG
ncbi:MAG: hypothetical protein ACUVTX_03825, partial [Bacteroidales bacterium]